jgi:hypothetical protein
MLFLLGLLLVAFFPAEIPISLGNSTLRPLDVYLVLSLYCLGLRQMSMKNASGAVSLCLPKDTSLVALLSLITFGLASILWAARISDVLRQVVEFIEIIIIFLLIVNTSTLKSINVSIRKFLSLLPILISANIFYLSLVDHRGILKILEYGKVNLLATLGLLFVVISMEYKKRLETKDALQVIFYLMIIIGSLKRLAWTCTGVGFLCWLVLTRKRQSRTYVIVTMVCILALSSTSLAIVFAPSIHIQNVLIKVQTLITPHRTLIADPLSYRAEIWSFAIALGLKNPLIGIGWGNWKFLSMKLALPPHTQGIHNYFILYFLELGLVGFLLFIMFVLSPLRALFYINDKDILRARIAKITIVTWMYLMPVLLTSNVDVMTTTLLIVVNTFATKLRLKKDSSLYRLDRARLRKVYPAPKAAIT